MVDSWESRKEQVGIFVVVDIVVVDREERVELEVEGGGDEGIVVVVWVVEVEVAPFLSPLVHYEVAGEVVPQPSPSHYYYYSLLSAPDFVLLHSDSDLDFQMLNFDL